MDLNDNFEEPEGLGVDEEDREYYSESDENDDEHENLENEASGELPAGINASNTWTLADVSAGVTISLDGVSKKAVSAAKKEFLAVQHNINHYVHGKEVIDLAMYFYSDRSPWFALFKQRLDSALVDAGFPGLQSPDEVIEFVLYLLICHVYGQSAGNIVSDPMWFQQPVGDISHERFQQIVQSLSCKADNKYGKDSWATSSDRSGDVHQAAAAFSRMCTKLSYTDSSSMTFDDDKIPLRSPLTSEVGLSRVYQKAGQAGPVIHLLVSVATGLICTAHLQVPKENMSQIYVKSLLMLTGEERIENVDLGGKSFYSDRAYTNAKLFQQIRNANGKAAGTVKTTGGGVLSFAKPKATRVPSGQLKIVSDKGSRASYAATSNSLHNVAYRARNKSGVLLLSTSNNEFQNEWNFTPYDHQPEPLQINYIPDEEPVDIIQLLIASGKNVREITTNQRSQDWFLLRMFCITSSVAVGVFSVIFQRFWEIYRTASMNQSLFAQYKNIFAIVRHSPGASISRQQPTVPADLTAEGLKATKTVDQLKKMAKEFNIKITPSDARKNEIVDLIVAQSGQLVRPVGTSLSLAFTEKWFLHPLTNSHLSTGLKNEKAALRGTVDFLDNNDPEFIFHSKVIQLSTFGLLRNDDEKHIAASVDGIILMQPTDPDVTDGDPPLPPIVAVVEMKTRTEKTTQQDAINLAAQLGAVSGCTASEEGASLFQQSIPHIAERWQMIHHAAVVDVEFVFYVESRVGKILRTVRVTVPLATRQNYRCLLRHISNEYLSWIHGSAEEQEAGPPPFETDGMFSSPQCPDQHTLMQTLSLHNAALQLVESTGKPMVCMKFIQPREIADWNMHKTAIDTTSQVVDSVKPASIKNKPSEFSVWEQFIMYSFVQIWRLSNINNVDPEKLHPDNDHFKSLNAMRADSRRAGQIPGAASQELSCRSFLRSKMFPALKQMRNTLVHGQPAEMPGLQLQNNAPMQTGENFDVASLAESRKRRNDSWNSQSGAQFRETYNLEVRHTARRVKASQRKHCAMCTKKCRTICLSCDEPMCIDEDGNDEEAPTCWEKWHSEGKI
jgi:hypothetical protein